jgi:hypothetical protein
MTVSVIGCGDSAKEWFKTPCDLSIGVNDCLKFGHQVDHLVVINAPAKFTAKAKNGYTDRLFTITSSKPKRFICHNGAWKQWFPSAELVPLKPFINSIKKGNVYKSKTSPIAAISLAYNAGAEDIILFGVDFLNHPNVKDKLLKSELHEYQRLFWCLEEKGTRCWLGNPNSRLIDYLEVWPVNVA